MLRGSANKTIRTMRLILYVATAAACAAAASDFVDNATASALGNVGLLLIMARLFIITPLAVARARNATRQWIHAESRHIARHYPWADMMGRAGWVMLGASVLMQMLLGVA